MVEDVYADQRARIDESSRERDVVGLGVGRRSVRVRHNDRGGVRLIALAELTEREIACLLYGAELNASEIGATVGIESAPIRTIPERARTRLGARIETLLSLDGGMP